MNNDARVKKSVVFLIWGESTKNFYKPLTDWYVEQGHDVSYLWYRNWSISKLRAANPDVVYFWNGEYDWLYETKRWCEEKRIEYYSVEIGWFPQTDSIYVDHHGTNGRCSLHFDDLGWLECADYTRLEQKRLGYLEGVNKWSGGYVLVPLQLTDDTTMQYWSPVKGNVAVVNMARRMFPDRKIIVRRHPKDRRNSYSELNIDWAEGETKSIEDMIMGAELVWGMNSTTLSEAALMGKPVIAAGKSFLNIGQDRNQALAAMVAREIPMNTVDLSPWMRPGRGLDHLNNHKLTQKDSTRHLGGHCGKTHVDNGVLSFFKDQLGCDSMVDVGCGPGGQVDLAESLGYDSVVGVDGDVSLLKRKSDIVIHDFTVAPLHLGGSFDLGWSCEFLEHVRECYMDNYMAVFERCKYVAVTYAPKGKRGHHHVNCRDEKYWVGMFESRGFVFEKELTSECRQASTMKRDFFRDTGLVFSQP